MQQDPSDVSRNGKAPRIIDLSAPGPRSNSRQEEQQRFQVQLDDETQHVAQQAVFKTPGVGEIVERDTSSSVRPPAPPSVPQKTGFPVPQARRRRLQQRVAAAPETQDAQEDEAKVARGDIHRDSDAMLAQMSEQDILEEQQKLMKALSPDLLAFVRKRAQGGQGAAHQAEETQPSSKPVELEATPSEQLEPHFTLSGSVVSVHVEHAHGDHVHAGPSQSYSISSLLRLARSTVAAQRATALTVLRRIIERNDWADSSGIVTSVIRPHLDEIVGISAVSLGLSERSHGVLAAAVSLIRALAGVPVGPLHAASEETLLPLLGGLRRQLTDRTLERNLLESIAETLSVLALTETAVKPILETPELLEQVAKLFICVPWPPFSGSEAPSPSAALLLQRIVEHSRESAKALMERRTALVDPLLRFVVAAPHEQMFAATLRLWTALARYGLGAEIRASAGLERHLIALETHVGSLQLGAEDSLIQSWYSLISAWSACATDPHNTEPPHSIVWTQAEEWGEGLRDGLRRHLSSRVDDSHSNGALAAAMDALAVWLEGAAINWVADRAQAFRDSCSDLVVSTQGVLSDTLLSLSSSVLPEAASLALACLRLSASLRASLPATGMAGAVDWLLAHTRLPRSASLLLASLTARLPSASIALLQAALERQQPGDGHASQALAIKLLERSGLDQTRLSLLRPFVVAACLASASIAPLRPQHATLPLVQTIRPAQMPESVLARTWPLTCVVEELLRSGQSDVIRALPAEKRDEAGLLEAALVAAELLFVHEACRPFDSDIVYDLMKVFMLEKDVAPSTSGPLFAQPAIAARLLSLACTHALQPDSQIGSLASVAFPDFYADFVELYAALSLGDPLFGRFLLAPLALDGGETIVGCARTLFHTNQAILRTIVDGAVDGHPALERKMSWAADEVLQGAMAAALEGGAVRPDRNKLLIGLMRRAM